MIPKKAITYSKPSPWIKAHLREDFDICSFSQGSRVLDVGCGYGKNLETFRVRGIDAVGVDPDMEGLSYCLALGFNAQCAHAECLPFPAASFDGLILDSVLQFTDPQKALLEAYRVLQPGGAVRLVVQGVGYALYVIQTRRGLGKLFGIRMILSTLWHKFTGQRLRDTVCFSPRSLKAQCERSGFHVDLLFEGSRYFGLPVFVYLQAHRQ
jgi:SAM-dependent methyltransferase